MRIAMLAAALAFATSTAFAHNCPYQMRIIDEALSTTKLDAKRVALIRDWRKRGEEYHKAGRHMESMDALAKAKKLFDPNTPLLQR